MSRYGRIGLLLMKLHMMRAISSPSSSTTGFATLIFAICCHLDGGPAGSAKRATIKAARSRSKPAAHHRGAFKRREIVLTSRARAADLLTAPSRLAADCFRPEE